MIGPDGDPDSVTAEEADAAYAAALDDLAALDGLATAADRKKDIDMLLRARRRYPAAQVRARVRVHKHAYEYDPHPAHLRHIQELQSISADLPEFVPDAEDDESS